MIWKYLGYILPLFLLLGGPVFAQDEDPQPTVDVQPMVDYQINKMKTELNLTDSQASAARPVVKDYFTKREEVFGQAQSDGILDHVAVKSSIRELRENEYQKLSKILSEDQLKKLINKDNLMTALNPDSVDSTVDDSASITPTGANIKF